MAAPRASSFVASTTHAAAAADAGTCFHRPFGRAECLPGLINIGVQKAGTGELQTWLGVHPAVATHGGEVHYFDGREKVACAQPRKRGHLRLRYASYLWRRRPRFTAEVTGKLVYEKTPAYFDRAPPQLVSCAVPSARILVMLRDPTDRARSAYAMCQREMGAAWCRAPFEQALGRVLLDGGDGGGSPRASRPALRRAPHLKRMLLMGQYAVFLRRWLDAFEPPRVRVFWLEGFKRDPFTCMAAVEAFAGLPHHPYRSIATQNAAGLYVVGKSKSSSAATSSDAAAAAGKVGAGGAAASPAASRTSNASEPMRAALTTLRAYYAPWQRRLRVLLVETNTSLLPLSAAGPLSVV